MAAKEHDEGKMLYVVRVDAVRRKVQLGIDMLQQLIAERQQSKPHQALVFRAAAQGLKVLLEVEEQVVPRAYLQANMAKVGNVRLNHKDLVRAMNVLDKVIQPRSPHGCKGGWPKTITRRRVA